MPPLKGTEPWNKGKTFPERIAGTIVNGHGVKKSDDEVFVEHSTYARHNLKSRIRKRNMIEYVCAICGMGPEWNGKPMPLILDHINGVHNDNRLDNLRFVCSNCDSQLDTYKSRNCKTRRAGRVV